MGKMMPTYRAKNALLTISGCGAVLTVFCLPEVGRCRTTMGWPGGSTFLRSFWDRCDSSLATFLWVVVQAMFNIQLFLSVSILQLRLLNRFKQKSAEWKAAEVFKCGVCSKVRLRTRKRQVEIIKYDRFWAAEVVSSVTVGCIATQSRSSAPSVPRPLVRLARRRFMRECTVDPSRSPASSAARASGLPPSAMCTCAATPRRGPSSVKYVTKCFLKPTR